MAEGTFFPTPAAGAKAQRDVVPIDIKRAAWGDLGTEGVVDVSGLLMRWVSEGKLRFVVDADLQEDVERLEENITQRELASSTPDEMCLFPFREAVERALGILSFAPHTCRRSEEHRGFRALIIPFGHGGCLVLFAIRDADVVLLVARDQHEHDYRWPELEHHLPASVHTHTLAGQSRVGDLAAPCQVGGNRAWEHYLLKFKYATCCVWFYRAVQADQQEQLTVQMIRILALGATAALVLAGCASLPSTGPMGFFITSEGSNKGADLGGIAGADAHCQKLAAAAGAGARTWRAYLSAPGTFPSATNAAGVPSINARDRIGNGPWYNAKGELIAQNVESLHTDNRISKTTALDEKGAIIKGRGDTPNQHDMLTGSRADGTAFAPQTDTTCKAWTSSTDGSAIVGHHDLTGPLPEAWARSWNFSHQSAGCSQEALVRTGGSGRFYCFASN